MKEEELQELEEIAKSFIIGFSPLTKEAREIVRKIELVKDGIKSSVLRTERLERMLQQYYLELMNVE